MGEKFKSVLAAVTTKRSIHGVTIISDEVKGNGDVFVQLRVVPHRSKNCWLECVFSARSEWDSKSPIIRVDIDTHTKPNCDAGAIGDALALVADLTTRWATLIQEATHS